MSTVIWMQQFDSQRKTISQNNKQIQIQYRMPLLLGTDTDPTCVHECEARKAQQQ